MKHDLSRQTLGDLLRRTRQRSPNQLAIRCGAVDWTYAEFDNVCDRLASGLAARGGDVCLDLRFLKDRGGSRKLQ